MAMAGKSSFGFVRTTDGGPLGLQMRLWMQLNAMTAADTDTQFQAAMAMLTSAAMPDWERVAALIDAAADGGHAEATERRALLECRGVGRSPDWAKALDSLTAAAGLGSQFAARQLVLLAEDRYQPAVPAKPPPDGWTEVRSRISIAQRASACPNLGTILSTSPIVHAVPDFASAAECQWLIDAAAPRLDRAGVYNNPTGVDPGRTNRSAPFNFANADLIVEMIRQRIANQLKAPLACLEMSQVLHYQIGQEFVLHCDFLDPQTMREEIARNGQRVATVLIYLNQEYEGGETGFPVLGINHRGKTGDLLVFGSVDHAGRPDPRSQHAGRPPTRGEKWVFSQWVRNQAPGRG